jgi:quinol monooxygenase YgiN
MINVNVKYTVLPEFSDTNRENIERFLESFRELDHTKFRYQVFVEDDGLTFYHHSAYLNEDIQQQLLAMPLFLEFQRQRDANLDGKPEIKTLKFQGSAGSFDNIFGNFDAPEI